MLQSNLTFKWKLSRLSLIRWMRLSPLWQRFLFKWCIKFTGVTFHLIIKLFQFLWLWKQGGKSPIFSFRIYFKSHTPGRLPQSSPPCWYLSTKHTLLTSRKRINLWCLNSGMQPRKDRALFWLLAIHGKICALFLVLIPLSLPGIPSSLLPRLVVSPWIALHGEFPSEAQDDWVLVQGRQQALLPHTHDFNSPYQQAGRGTVTA